VGRHCRLGVVTPPPLAQRIALGLMHPTPADIPFHRTGWVYEEKVDGYRMAAMKAADGTRLINRNGIYHTKRFSGLVQALAALTDHAFLLDGEVAVLYDEALISRFEWLRGRPKDALATEPVYMVFDLLELGGKDLHRRALAGRRRPGSSSRTSACASRPRARFFADTLPRVPPHARAFSPDPSGSRGRCWRSLRRTAHMSELGSVPDQLTLARALRFAHPTSSQPVR